MTPETPTSTPISTELPVTQAQVSALAEGQTPPVSNPETAAAATPAAEAEPDNLITIGDFAKVELRVAEIVEAERVPKTDKLMRVIVSLGDEQRQVVAGIAAYYEPEALLGKRVVMVANLKPVKLRGVESHGMLLAAKAGEQLSLVTPLNEVAVGAVIS